MPLTRLQRRRLAEQGRDAETEIVQAQDNPELNLRRSMIPRPPAKRLLPLNIAPHTLPKKKKGRWHFNGKFIKTADALKMLGENENISQSTPVEENNVVFLFDPNELDPHVEPLSPVEREGDLPFGEAATPTDENFSASIYNETTIIEHSHFDNIQPGLTSSKELQESDSNATAYYSIHQESTILEV